MLLSGGLDSAVCLAEGVRHGEVRLALTFDYGQKAAAREKEYSRKLAAYYGVPSEIVELPFLKRLTTTALVSQEPLPELSCEVLDDIGIVQESADRVWVPNRNALFLSIAACYAESMGCEAVVAGFNAEEAATFPDNSGEFVEAINHTFFYATRGKVSVLSYTQSLTKREILKLGMELGLPFEMVWSCYYGGTVMCGKCESCCRMRRAIRDEGLAGSMLKIRMEGDCL